MLVKYRSRGRGRELRAGCRALGSNRAQVMVNTR